MFRFGGKDAQVAGFFAECACTQDGPRGGDVLAAVQFAGGEIHDVHVGSPQQPSCNGDRNDHQNAQDLHAGADAGARVDPVERHEHTNLLPYGFLYDQASHGVVKIVITMLSSSGLTLPGFCGIAPPTSAQILAPLSTPLRDHVRPLRHEDRKDPRQRVAPTGIFRLDKRRGRRAQP